ncbi:hypothetical protein [Vitiosangium sp. GDMCC 1.1324]|uniref:hypothetical protein n=1 Tax=Vitiosangium sp. (strain GDMCC 1.1324) TaxID=2138576 RepID=UPI000D38F7E0|nr:hypothetical protein [Vitiosangium sp. GDMCC 1.1324]PTL85475.1 hypothetical protein DAT35_01785 [Vitiosangium sp. GDMCC 1.1324]
MSRSAPAIIALELPQDASGFVRRECPQCRRDFKTRPCRHDASILQRRLASLFPFENAHESFDEVPDWWCLYCGYRAPGDEWLTPAQQAHVEALARAWANHVRYEQLAYVSRTLSLNPRPTFVSVEPEALPGPMPQDTDDLRVIPLVCCGEEVKALWDWDGPLFCPRCGSRHGGLSGRQQIHLQFIEE